MDTFRVPEDHAGLQFLAALLGGGTLVSAFGGGRVLDAHVATARVLLRAKHH